MSSDCIELADFKSPTLAVEATNLMLSFGKAKLLDDANLKVPKGAVLALLGPSGCGKTTLLKCLLGLLKPQSGDVKVFGQKPGSKDSLVPGSAVGYMPQEEGLFGAFTIEETLMYFAKLAGKSLLFAEAKIKEIIALLELPSSSQLASQLSGGQRKRLSLAAALVNGAPLLVLDEPTVGNDVLLIKKIWNHLVKMTLEQRTTVIITTHYIAEARQAHIVVFMRGGKILCETAPQQLYSFLSVDTLEKAFLKLCKLTNSGSQERGCASGSKYNSKTLIEGHFSIPTVSFLPTLVRTNNDLSSFGEYSFEEMEFKTKARLSRKFVRIRAHVWKNFVTEKNHPMLLLIKIALVLSHIIFLPQIYGRNPRDLNMKVFRGDDGNISRKILSHVDKKVLDWHEPFSGDSYDNIALWECGSIRFPQNYSRDIENIRIDSDVDDCLYWPQLQLYADLSNKSLSMRWRERF